MLGAILYRLIPSAEGSFQTLLEQWWLAPVLVILSLIFFWRHTTLAYGDMKFANGWVIVTAVTLIVATPYLFSIPVGNSALIQLILMTFMMDRFVNSLAVRRSPFFVFDIGVLLGLLSMMHPAYLLLIPYFLIKFHQLEISSLAHTLAQLLGVFTIWLLYLFLFAAPNLSSIGEALFTKIEPLLSPKVPALSDIPIIAALIIFLVGTMVVFYHSYIRSIRRVRYLYQSHLKYSWLLLPISIIYGELSTPTLLAMMLMILIFASSPALYFSSLRGESRYQSLIFFSFALLIGLVMYWQSPYFHTLFTF